VRLKDGGGIMALLFVKPLQTIEQDQKLINEANTRPKIITSKVRTPAEIIIQFSSQKVIMLVNFTDSISEFRLTLNMKLSLC
jgi:hypothetical protein